MRKIEIAALIKLMYDFRPTEETETKPYKDIVLHAIPNNYLVRKGYLHNIKSPVSGTPTRKCYKLLQKLDVEIFDLKDRQKEFKENGYVIVFDKFGNEHRV